LRKPDLQRFDRMNPLRANHHRVVAATTPLASVGVRKLWHWSPLPALVVIPLMLALDLAFLSANLLELFQGGGVHLGETKPMAGAAVPNSARPLLSQLDQTAAVLPRVHPACSLLKRWILGTHRGSVSLTSTAIPRSLPSGSTAAARTKPRRSSVSPR
jgi:hypothetical protein